MNMTWEQVQAMPCRQFVAWVDEEHREAVCGRLRRTRLPASELDIYEAWGGLLMWLYTHDRTAVNWQSSGHFRAYCIAWLWRSVPQIDRTRKARRISRYSGEVVAERFFSELAQEHLDKLRMMAAVEREAKPSELGPSKHGWLTQALKDLSPRKREMVELCIVGEYTVTQAADLLECSVAAVCSSRNGAMKFLKSKAAQMEVA